MEIKKTEIGDLDIVMSTIDSARQLMRDSGNTTQWTNGYPSKALMIGSIKAGHNFLIYQDDEVVATFDFVIGEDPNYLVIENGNWLNNAPYGVVHRLASTGEAKGVAKSCFEWCFSQFPNIRVDTHEDNIPMQKVLTKLNYEKCGVIYVSDGTPRLAFQKIK